MGRMKQIAAFSAIVVLGLFIFFSLFNFIPAFLGAIVLYIVSFPLMNFLHVKKRIPKGLSIFIIILITFLVILVPIYYTVNLLIDKLSSMLSHNTDVFFKIHDANAFLRDNFGINALTPENIVKVQNEVTSMIPNMLNQTLGLLADIGIMYFVLFYLLYTDYHIKDRIMSWMPFKKENSELFAQELISQTYSNVLGAPVLAIIQGLFSVGGFMFFGLQEPVFWGIMCAFLSFIPLVGTAILWVPAGLIQLIVGESWQGIGILLYGAIVITNVDNVFRFVLMKKMADVHPITTVFGVIIGLNWFGLPGLIFGPILISYFLILLKVYRLEFGDRNILSGEQSNTSNSGS